MDPDEGQTEMNEKRQNQIRLQREIQQSNGLKKAQDAVIGALRVFIQSLIMLCLVVCYATCCDLESDFIKPHVVGVCRCLSRNCARTTVQSDLNVENRRGTGIRSKFPRHQCI